MYAIEVALDTVEFIGKHFNDGVVPEVPEVKTFFIIGDGTTPNEIITLNQFLNRYDNFRAIHHSTLFKME